VLQHWLEKEETQQTAHWCIVHATQSNSCSALDFLSPEPCPQQPCGLNALITFLPKISKSIPMSESYSNPKVGLLRYGVV